MIVKISTCIDVFDFDELRDIVIDIINDNEIDFSVLDDDNTIKRLYDEEYEECEEYDNCSITDISKDDIEDFLQNYGDLFLECYGGTFYDLFRQSVNEMDAELIED